MVKPSPLSKSQNIDDIIIENKKRDLEILKTFLDKCINMPDCGITALCKNYIKNTWSIN